jgi:hypothetical protein
MASEVDDFDCQEIGILVPFGLVCLQNIGLYELASRNRVWPKGVRCYESGFLPVSSFQRINDLSPFLVKRTTGKFATGATVPVSRIAIIAFNSMKITMDSAGHCIVSTLNNLMGGVPVTGLCQIHCG